MRSGDRAIAFDGSSLDFLEAKLQQALQLPEKITLSGNDGDDAPNYHEKRVISDLQKLKEIEE
ncbi:MAG: hypothetical protein ACM65K_07905 [Microcoleus sp.]